MVETCEQGRKVNTSITLLLLFADTRPRDRRAVEALSGGHANSEVSDFLELSLRIGTHWLWFYT